jgi:L-asparaginase/Glu-tRNA(Gln) amidotransferase subunit D
MSCAKKKTNANLTHLNRRHSFRLPTLLKKIIHPSAKLRQKETGDIDFKNEFSAGIFQVSLIPGLEPELLCQLLKEDKCKGIILQSFGAGNVPNDRKYSLTNFISESRILGKPVLITSQFPAGATLHTAYEPGKEAVEAGAIPTGNMTYACAMAKFRWVLAQTGKMNLEKEEKLMKITAMMNCSYIGELDESDS